MKLAVGSDEKTKLTDWTIEYLKKKGHKVQLFGALVKPKALWAQVAWEVAEAVKEGRADEGILFCWTGTGVALAASKVPGIRAVTVTDAKTAEVARKWNHANVLSMSCFLPQKAAKAIIDTWFSTDCSKQPDDMAGIEILNEIEEKYSK
jgi:ribose 5-phosphate isomerase B